METLKFAPDARMRKRFFHADSFQHPAKMACGLFLECLERYTKPGDIVLDPMAGSGTALLGALYGRHMVLNEMENHFISPMLKSWAKMQHGPALGHTLGEVLILRGDARCLPLRGFLIENPSSRGGLSDTDGLIKYGEARPLATVEGQQAPINCVVTSPPFQGVVPGQDAEFLVQKYKRKDGKPAGIGKALRGGYTRPVDAVVTSPSYEATLQGSGADAARRRIAAGKYKGMRPDVWTSPSNIAGSTFGNGYSHASENIGNLRGQAYWDSMRMCYAEMHRVLKPNGILCLVLKGYTRAGVYQDLPAQTAELVESLGFTRFDEWRRELWSLSFWRILQRRRDPAAFDDRLRYETVLAFRRG